MFELTREETLSLRSQNAILKRGKHSKFLPYAFSEHGILMLAKVLKSRRAIQVSVKIIDVFIRMREMLLTHKGLLLKVEQLERKYSDHDRKIQKIFEFLKKLIVQKNTPRKPIGYIKR